MTLTSNLTSYVSPITKADIETIAKSIETQEQHEWHFEEHCGRSILDALLQRGFKTTKSKFHCTVASFETNVVKGNIKVNIVESTLFGPFTQVTFV